MLKKKQVLASSSQVTLSTTPVLKIIICGESGVGKSALVKSFGAEVIDKSFSLIGVQFHIREVMDTEEQREQKFILQIWDLGGQGWQSDMVTNSLYCRGAHGALVCFDLTDITSLKEVSKWITEVLPPKIPIVLVGTKGDLVCEGIDDSIGYLIGQISTKFRIQFMLTSAIHKHSVNETFETLLSLILHPETM